jgi:hypothetical protein
MKKIKDRSERHRRRAAAGLSLHRLIKRGLLERLARGCWRLTPAGVKLVRALYPEIKPLTETELARASAFDKTLSKAFHQLGPRKRIKRPDKERIIARLREMIIGRAPQETGSGVEAESGTSKK